MVGVSIADLVKNQVRRTGQTYGRLVHVLSEQYRRKYFSTWIAEIVHDVTITVAFVTYVFVAIKGYGDATAVIDAVYEEYRQVPDLLLIL